MGELDFRLMGGFLIPNAILQWVFLQHKPAFVVVWCLKLKVYSLTIATRSLFIVHVHHSSHRLWRNNWRVLLPWQMLAGSSFPQHYSHITWPFLLRSMDIIILVKQLLLSSSSPSSSPPSSPPSSKSFSSCRCSSHKILLSPYWLLIGRWAKLETCYWWVVDVCALSFPSIF